nr:aldo/keto reductase [Kitasatospora sp. CB01950]
MHRQPRPPGGDPLAAGAEERGGLLDNLSLDHLGPYLMHQPFNDVFGAWRAREELLGEGRVRAIGVSNLHPGRFLDLVTHSRIAPAVHQCETHPFHQQTELGPAHDRHGTVLQSRGPPTQGNPDLHADPVLRRIAAAHGRTVPQVVLRRLLQRGIPLVAKSTDPARLRQNIAVFDSGSPPRR